MEKKESKFTYWLKKLITLEVVFIILKGLLVLYLLFARIPVHYLLILGFGGGIILTIIYKIIKKLF